MSNDQIFNGTYFKAETPRRVINTLEQARLGGYRVRIWYGDTQTGRAWDDVPEAGYIKRSLGPVKVPLLVYNNRSLGGPSLLDHCIIKIAHANKKNGGVLYQWESNNVA